MKRPKLAQGEVEDHHAVVLQVEGLGLTGTVSGIGIRGLYFKAEVYTVECRVLSY